MYSCGMENEHSIDSLRTVLRALHDKIEALEAGATLDRRDWKLRKRIEEAKLEEAIILAKVAKSGVKL